MLPPRDYRDLTPELIAHGDPSGWVAVLPLGATEQHGPHLPPQTDLIIADGVAARLSKALAPTFPVTFLPAEPVGYSPEHLDYPGTISLGYDKAIERWIGIGRGLAEQGIRRLMLLNAHGGNSPLLAIVSTELRMRHSMLCVATGWARFGYPDGLISDDEKSFGIHGGEIETSVMLALAPDQVDMSRTSDYASFQQEMTSRYRHLRAYGGHSMGWKMQDLNPLGAAGNARLATQEKGEALLDHAVSGLCELADEMRDFDIAHFDRPPI
jgi:creatinine amidohydrolase